MTHTCTVTSHEVCGIPEVLVFCSVMLTMNCLDGVVYISQIPHGLPYGHRLGGGMATL